MENLTIHPLSHHGCKVQRFHDQLITCEESFPVCLLLQCLLVKIVSRALTPPPLSLQGITPCSLSVEPFPGIGLTQGPMQLASKHPLNQDPPLLTLRGATPSTTMAAFSENDSVVIFVGTRNGSVREVSQ